MLTPLQAVGTRKRYRNFPVEKLQEEFEGIVNVLQSDDASTHSDRLALLCEELLYRLNSK